MYRGWGSSRPFYECLATIYNCMLIALWVFVVFMEIICTDLAIKRIYCQKCTKTSPNFLSLVDLYLKK